MWPEDTQGRLKMVGLEVEKDEGVMVALTKIQRCKTAWTFGKTESSPDWSCETNGYGAIRYKDIESGAKWLGPSIHSLDKYCGAFVLGAWQK